MKEKTTPPAERLFDQWAHKRALLNSIAERLPPISGSGELCRILDAAESACPHCRRHVG